MAGNPRIDDLRRRLEKDPGSRLFAQLAEELRKDGDLEEAIAVCREGLKRQPAYPSARMTLGRALFDTGDLAAARAEFETVLKGAADNILASRLLAECLDGLGDLAGAARQYRATLALAPSDKQVQAHLADVEKRMKSAPASPAPAPASAYSTATVIMQSPVAPPPAAEPSARSFEGAPDTSPDRFPMPEPERPKPAEVQRDYAPIPLVAADETFELEAAHESVPTKVGGGSANAAGSGWVVGIAQPMPPPEGTAAPPPAAGPEPFPMPEEPPAAAPLPPLQVSAAPEEAFEVEHGYDSPIPAPRTAEQATDPHLHADFSEEFAPPEREVRPISSVPLELPPLPAEPPPAPPEPAPVAEPARVAEPEPVARPEPVAAPEPLPPPAAAPPPPQVTAPAPPPPFHEEWKPPRVEPAPPPTPPAWTPTPPWTPPAAPEIATASFEPKPSPAPPAPAAAAPAPPEPAAAPEADLSSATLAELYFNQGHTEKALVVYRQLLQREPGNDRARARIAEMEALERHLRAEEARTPLGAGAATPDPAAARRQAIERTIARLEGLLAVVKKEAP